MQPDIPDDLISLPQAAKLLGVSRQSVLRWLLSGKLPGFRVGHRWRVRKVDVLALCKPWTAADANDRKLEMERALPLSKKELAEREAQIDQRLREIGVRR